MAIGVTDDSNHDKTNVGSVYLYDVASRRIIPAVHNPEPVAFGLFDSSLAVSDGILAVAALGNAGNGVSLSGAVYLYDLETVVQNRQTVMAAQ